MQGGRGDPFLRKTPETHRFLDHGCRPFVRYQPNRDYVSNDDIQTPPALARQLLDHFKPRGGVLEPCRGDGNIFRLLPAGSFWCEIKEDRDFFARDRPVDWIITNPPWSQVRRFLQHAMSISENVVFLLTINHVWTKARLLDIWAEGFGLREIVLVDMPASFPQSGFQLGAVLLERSWKGAVSLTDLTSHAGCAENPAKGETANQRS